MFLSLDLNCINYTFSFSYFFVSSKTKKLYMYEAFISLCIVGQWRTKFIAGIFNLTPMIINHLKMDSILTRCFQNPIKVEPKDKKKFLPKKHKNIHKSFAFVLILAQCFGQLPVQGITSPDVQALHFSWMSWKCGYSILICAGAMFYCSMQIGVLLTRGMNLYEISKFQHVIASSSIYIIICFVLTTIVFALIERV